MATSFIAHWPAGIKKTLEGKIVRDVAHILDIMPTVIGFSGAEYPAIAHEELIPEPTGKSLLPIFDGKRHHAHEYLFFEHELNCAVRSGDWKAISTYGEYDWELYNIKTDRNELDDVADEHPEVVERLDRAWRTWALEAKAAPKGRWQDRGHRTPRE